MRLLKNLSPKIEWYYLINENFIGENLIVPLLLNVYEDTNLPQALKPIIYKQIEDENRHASEYGVFVGDMKLKGSGYNKSFEKSFYHLETCAEKLFALQGVLEGIALGCFYHRYKYWQSHAAEKVDRRSIQDEMEHVAFSYRHFDQLKSKEGIVTPDQFLKVKKELNASFKQTFNLEHIPKVLLQDFGVKVNVEQISKEAYETFCSNSRRILNRNLDRFLKNYYAETR